MEKNEINIRTVFPKARYIKAKNPEIEDDMIYLTNRLHIQVGIMDDMYSLIDEREDVIKYLYQDKDLQKVYSEAINYIIPNLYSVN